MNIKHLRRVIGNAVCGDLHRMPQQELDEAIDALDELEKLARQQESEGVVVEIDNLVIVNASIPMSEFKQLSGTYRLTRIEDDQ